MDATKREMARLDSNFDVTEKSGEPAWVLASKGFAMAANEPLTAVLDSTVLAASVWMKNKKQVLIRRGIGIIEVLVP
ncbi:MAG: hypothetical protein WBA92_06180 [Pseudorhodobacter sp.]